MSVSHYLSPKNIFTHENPQELVQDFAGSGFSCSGQVDPGAPGYVERINFGETIGHYNDRKTGSQAPTTWGVIHYGKDGVHIIPSRKPRLKSSPPMSIAGHVWNYVLSSCTLLGRKLNSTYQKSLNSHCHSSDKQDSNRTHLCPIDLVLSARAALIGGVVSGLRAVTIKGEGSEIVLNYYFEGSLDWKDRDLTSVASAEVVSDFAKDEDGNWITIRANAIELEPSEQVPKSGILVYHRYEKEFHLEKDPFPITKNGLCPNEYCSLIAWRALIGKVLPEFRAVYICQEEQTVQIFFLVDGPISSLAQKIANEVCDQIKIPAPENQNAPVASYLIRRDTPESRPQLAAVYLRSEPSSIIEDPTLTLMELLSMV